MSSNFLRFPICSLVICLKTQFSVILFDGFCLFSVNCFAVPNHLWRQREKRLFQRSDWVSGEFKQTLLLCSIFHCFFWFSFWEFQSKGKDVILEALPENEGNKSAKQKKKLTIHFLSLWRTTKMMQKLSSEQKFWGMRKLLQIWKKIYDLYEKIYDNTNYQIYFFSAIVLIGAILLVFREPYRRSQQFFFEFFSVEIWC